jgi:putative methyltransferase (TIGR04325 family)
MTRCAKILEDDSLRFFDNIEAAASHLGTIDVVLMSSSLQYTSDPLKALIELLKLRAKRVFITRTTFNHEGSRLITIQRSRLSSNGPGPLPPGIHDRDVFYPITFEPLAAVEQLISSHGYRIRYRVTEGATHNGINGPIFAYSYLAELF